MYSNIHMMAEWSEIQTTKREVSGSNSGSIRTRYISIPEGVGKIITRHISYGKKFITHIKALCGFSGMQPRPTD
jgi:hypothetical protein